MKRGCTEGIITEVRKIDNLTEDIAINEALIHQRLKQNLFTGIGHGGTPSPLAEIEPYIVDMLIILAWIPEWLSPTECVHFINDLINRPEV